MNKKRAMSSEEASYVKIKGHKDARDFASLLGIGKEYTSEPQAKKDVIDTEGNAFSVKSGEKKWQIFLYGKTRFSEDYDFRGMNGISAIFLECINAFPESREEYLKNKIIYKEKLKIPMKKLCEKLKEKRLIEAFLYKSIFNSGEVNYLVIKVGFNYHIFSNKEVVKVLSERISVENSKARQIGQIDDQKVVFKVDNRTIGEIEMRNDSNVHYREVKFWLDKDKTFEILQENIQNRCLLKENIIIYGESIKKLKKVYNK